MLPWCPDAYGWVGVAAALALQGYVAEERVGVRALQRSYPKLPALSIRISRRVGLGVNAYLDFFTSAILAPKSNIAEEGVPTDSLTLKQQGEWVIRDSTAGTGQAQEGIILPSSPLPCPGPPVIDFHGARDHGPNPIPFARCWGGDRVGCGRLALGTALPTARMIPPRPEGSSDCHETGKFRV